MLSLPSLKQLEQLFVQPAQNSDGVFWLFYPDSNRLIYISVSSQEIGQQPCESQHKQDSGFSDAIGTESAERCVGAIPEQIQESYRKKYTIVRSDGAVRWIESRAFPLRNEKEEISMVIGIEKDITHRLQPQLERAQFLAQAPAGCAEAERAREPDASIPESIRDGFVSFDSLWRCTGANRKAEELLEKTRSELTGRNIKEVFSAAPDSDYYIQCHQVLAERVILECEEFFAPLNKWLAIRIAPCAGGVCAYFQDITHRKRAEAALKESEERLRLALSAAGLGYWDWDLLTNRVILSENCGQLFGRCLEKFGGTAEGLLEFVYAKDRKSIALAFARAIERGADCEAEFRLVWADGNIRWVKTKGRVFCDPTGKPVRMVGTVMDITHSKEEAAALREANKRISNILESITDAFFAVDREWRFTYVNHQGEKILQKRETELLGHNLWEVFPEAVGTAFYQNYCQAMETGVPAHFEEFYAPLNLWCEVHAYPSRDGLSIYFRDIRERKRAEDQIKFQANVLSQVNDAVIAVDLEKRITYWNKGAERLYGCKSEAVLGRPLREAYEYSWIKPEDEWEARGALAGTGNWHGEVTHAKNSGEKICVEVSASVLKDEAGRNTGSLAVIRDITQRVRVEEALRLSEQRFAVALQNSPVVVFNQDTELRYTWIYNPKLGYAANEILGKTDADLTYSEDAAHLIEIKRRVLETGIGTRAEVALRSSREQEFSYYDLTVEPLRDEYGNIVGITASGTDISERKKMEAERERLLKLERADRAEAETANRIKDEFLAILSHELRTPLTPILGWVKLLRTLKFDEAKTAHALETIERNAKLQSQLIEDLLDVSRILRGKLGLNLCPVDLAGTVRAAIETVRLLAEAKSIQIQLAICAAGCKVLADPNRLQQVVWNLLTNAIKFTPSGGRVGIRLDAAGGRAQIQVSDTGKGISPDFLPFVFDYFRQADSKTTRKHGGLGLGLAIVRQLAELHGGSVSAESAGEGLGATFTVTLPLLEQNAGTLVSGTLESSEPNSSRRLDGVRVLVVDDEADTREFIAFTLEQYGARVRAVASAPAALEEIPLWKPDLLLSDIGMPEMDGYMLIRKIRALAPEGGGQIPAIALTAYAGETNRELIISAGFQKHLTKPVEPVHLAAAVAELTKK
ncbi:PAS domain S-box protein [Kamptonema formosum]|uniref:PAS domain S-box protein n=1 Tax=Kamptonema formosum TaxID=331992 RepID=UPI000345B83B|nr:PAS domain S-box protein [Oscillatoria sp. PCC 10802]